MVFKTMKAPRPPMHFTAVGGQNNHVNGALLIESSEVGWYVNNLFYSIYKYLPNYTWWTIKIIKKINL
jgi:hypothetical protein